MPSPETATAFALAQSTNNSSGWFNRCLAFVNQAWGNSVSWLGMGTALESWNAAPNKQTSGVPPAGAVVYFSDNNPDGHAALSMGQGRIATTDFCKLGGVCITTIDALTQRWGATELGWALPGASSATAAPSDTDSLGTTLAGGAEAAASPAVIILDWLAHKALPKGWAHKLAFIVLGMLLVFFGIYILVGE